MLKQVSLVVATVVLGMAVPAVAGAATPIPRVAGPLPVTVTSHPFGAALRAIGEAGLDVEDEDQRLLERGLFVYDALYAWCRRHTGAASSSV